MMNLDLDLNTVFTFMSLFLTVTGFLFRRQIEHFTDNWSASRARKKDERESAKLAYTQKIHDDPLALTTAVSNLIFIGVFTILLFLLGLLCLSVTFMALLFNATLYSIAISFAATMILFYLSINASRRMISLRTIIEAAQSIA